jgi:UDP-2,4-diacetamido-2,4,6-trideoxy-beta-L-altropyranose hydrolase
VDLGQIDQDLKSAYLELIANYNLMKAINLQLCDGLGVNRIMENIQTLTESDLQLRLATMGDIKQVFEWQCAPQTRRYAINKDVPSLSEHQGWMTRKIASKDDYFYIIELKSGNKVGFNSVGVVRLDLVSANTYTISIFIASTHFGRGIAKQALRLLDKLHPSIIINAVALKENLASQTLFSRAGYLKIDEENYTRQPVT